MSERIIGVQNFNQKFPAVWRKLTKVVGGNFLIHTVYYTSSATNKTQFITIFKITKSLTVARYWVFSRRTRSGWRRNYRKLWRRSKAKIGWCWLELQAHHLTENWNLWWALIRRLFLSHDLIMRLDMVNYTQQCFVSGLLHHHHHHKIFQ